MPHGRSLLRAVGILLGVLALAGSASAQQPSLLFYQNSQDQSPSIDTQTLGAGPTVSGYLGAIVGSARNIQGDGDDDLMWYADTSGNIASKVISTGANGPTVTAAMLSGANPGAARHFSIDPAENLLYVSITDDTVQIFDTDAMQQVGSIPSASFGGAAVGAFRHTAIDSVNRLIYYASTDSSVYSFSLDDFAVAGPTVSSASLAGAQPGAARHIVYDPNTGLLWYSVSDTSVASIAPGTGQAGPTLASNLFSDGIGAGRIITMTYQVVPEAGSQTARGMALLALFALGRHRKLATPRPRR